MTIIEAVLGLVILILVFWGLLFGSWHLVHGFRRKHRLEREEDERRRKRLAAEDLAQLIKENEALSGLTFRDYLETTPQVSPRKLEKLP